jgi:single-stranded-DNA-specific exonuclease
LSALRNIAKFDREADISDLVFIIGPRINAAGRIAQGSEAVDLLVESNYEIAMQKAEKIQINNDERKGLDKEITDEAMQMMEDEYYSSRKSTVLFQPHWHKGVIGIVASRLIERHYKPTIILTESNGKVVGSGRSIFGFDLHEAIGACSEHLIQFGGHKYAAGLTMEIDQVPLFIEKFEAYVQQNITEEILTPFVNIDAEIELNQINEKFYNIISQMAPFGPMNMKPTFMTRGVRDAGYTQLIKEEHLKLHITKDNQPKVFGIGFGMWYLIPTIRNNKTFNVCYQLYENEWNGNKRIELQVKDVQA